MVAIPLRRSVFARARWLILSPHADDETLGVGALIAETARAGRLACIAFLTDGSGSHPHRGAASRQRLIRARRREAGLALRRLAGKSAPAPMFLDWCDADPHATRTREFALTRDRLAVLCRLRRVDAIAVTARSDPHCDHVAAFGLARAVCDTVPRRIALFEYGVWSDPSARRTFESGPISAGRRRHALHAHRSQLTASLGPGFRLPPGTMRRPARDRLMLWRRSDAA